VFCYYVYVHCLERLSPKWPILCWVGRKTLLTHFLSFTLAQSQSLTWLREMAWSMTATCFALCNRTADVYRWISVTYYTSTISITDACWCLGGGVVYVGETRLPFGQQPLLLYGGGLTLQTSSGSVQAILLDTHSFMSTTEPPSTIDQVNVLSYLHCYTQWQEAASERIIGAHNMVDVKLPPKSGNLSSKFGILERKLFDRLKFWAWQLPCCSVVFSHCAIGCTLSWNVLMWLVKISSCDICELELFTNKAIFLWLWTILPFEIALLMGSIFQL